MRTPEHKIAQPRAGKHFEDELQLRYMAPGAFTVLPPDDNPPDPPSAPEPYRLTPSTRRQKNKAFAIIGEVDSSRANSRSPSPTGRVSPFRGRGFNPVGSRFASPNPTPPPLEDARLTPTNLSPRHASKIPKLKKRGSSSAFGEKVMHYDSSPTKRKLESKLSQSLSSLEQKKIGTKPPPSPRKYVHSKTPAFQKLSPIAGSSPEPSQSLSSPSRIPKSRSTPPSRRTSPTRISSSVSYKPPSVSNSSRTVSRAHSRNQSRNQSRNTSREASPTKDPTSPTRIPVKYRNVSAKVNSFNKPKPKVPPKPQVLTDQSEESSDVAKDVKPRPYLTRKESVNKLKTNSRANLIQKTEHNSNNITSDSSSDPTNKVIHKNDVKTNSNNNKPTVNKSSNNSHNKIERDKDEVLRSPEKKAQKQPQKEDHKDSQQILNQISVNNKSKSSPVKTISKSNYKDTIITSDTDTSYIKETTDSSNEEKKTRKIGSPVKLADIMPSTTTVVSSTTSTVTQPLKIDTNINTSKLLDKSKQISPMVDGRVLSATSVSNAMNRMNDTVLNTQTVIKEHGFSRMSPAANAIISVASETGKGNNTIPDIRSTTTAMPKQELHGSENMTNTNYNKPINVESNKISNTDNNKTLINSDRAADKITSNINRTTSSGTRMVSSDFNTANTNNNRVNGSEYNNSSNPSLNTKYVTTALPRVEPLSENKIVTDDRPNERGNNNVNHLSHGGIISAKALEMEVQKNMHKLISPEHITGNSIQKSINDRIKEARTVVAADVKPIRIMVKEKPSDIEVQSGNIRPAVSVSNGLNERPSLPPADHTPPPAEQEKETPPKNACSRFFSNCKNKMGCQCCKKQPIPETRDVEAVESKGCFSCLKKKPDDTVRISIEDETGKKVRVWDKLKCCNKQKVADTSCFPTGKRKNSWVDRRADSILSDQQEPPKRSKCSKDCCKSFCRKLFCINLCCKSKVKEEPLSRKTSVMSKKKSLTPTAAPPPEDTKSKIDLSLVEQTSHMRGAIPVLPICLAWFCLVMNCIAPGTGTFLSGLFCLCIGKPRFSQRDGPRPRIGSFIINTFIGFGQFFTVLFCLVGWGWSIWWGVIMVKTAKKYKKLKLMEAIEEQNSLPPPPVNQNHNSRNPIRNA